MSPPLGNPIDHDAVLLRVYRLLLHPIQLDAHGLGANAPVNPPNSIGNGKNRVVVINYRDEIKI